MGALYADPQERAARYLVDKLKKFDWLSCPFLRRHGRDREADSKRHGSRRP